MLNISLRPIFYRSSIFSFSRCFSTQSPIKQLRDVLTQQAHFEKSRQKTPDISKTFLKDNPYEMVSEEGSLDMKLLRQTNKYNVEISFQITNPITDNWNGNNGDLEGEVTDFLVKVSHKHDPKSALTFYCSTYHGNPPNRFVIGNVRNTDGEEVKDAYPGPAFEDLHEDIQLGLDVWLSKECGITPDLCDFIDAEAVRKEQQEYTLWLENVKKMLTGL